jgi:hypothetical protein
MDEGGSALIDVREGPKMGLGDFGLQSARCLGARWSITWRDEQGLRAPRLPVVAGTERIPSCGITRPLLSLVFTASTMRGGRSLDETSRVREILIPPW